ncbi:MAG TPA: TrmH family RNA methyltransferase [Nannocystaceae bacterium]|nr:TrmH family RNA methyltransferase [Nannocystaceae bacterium]
MADDDDEDVRIVGVGPHPQPWPDDPRLDAALLANGDRRNVIDRFRYWTTDAIVAELDAHRHPFHVAVENWTRDANIGAIVRSANAFAAAAVHVVGRRKWNRRGAMMTERYQHVHHHDTLASLVDATGDLVLVGIDNLPGAQPLPEAELPRACVLLFGQEGPGLSDEARSACTRVVSIPQFGSTRSINASAAAAIAMFEWCRRHAHIAAVLSGASS